MNTFEGVYVVIVTPFRSNGEVDYAGIRKNVEWLVAQGVHGIVALGSTGEFASLEDREKTKVAEATLEAVGGRVPIVVGATAETTDKVIGYARKAKEMNAAGVLVLASLLLHAKPGCRPLRLCCGPSRFAARVGAL
jgi:dihydrodipicolinate synthase/N-acetylneuraminate lyase